MYVYKYIYIYIHISMCIIERCIYVNIPICMYMGGVGACRKEWMWAQHGRSISMAGGLWSENGYRATAPATSRFQLRNRLNLIILSS